MGERSASSGQESSEQPAHGVDEPVAVVIVNYRTPELTVNCLAGLQKERSAFRDLRVLLVDGGSGDGSVDQLAAFIERGEFRDWVDLLALPINGGFGWANNQAIQRLLAKTGETPRYIHLLNPDAEPEPGAVHFLARYLNGHPSAGAVGSQLLELDESSSGSAFTFPSIRGEFCRGARTGLLDRLLRVPPISINASEATEVDWVTGASVMLRVEALRDVGLFDEGIFLYHEEVELMWRMRKAGWTIAIEPRSRVRHIGGAATGMHGRVSSKSAQPRVPVYFYRSRTRFFGLTRGRSVAALAFLAWLGGHAMWTTRRLFGLARGSNGIEHQLRDHVVNAFPRKHDFARAAPTPDTPPTEAPAWMAKRWL
jgi:N-acetylglucosaminyl-diphospho-decaprenol L-rhamnosyltransferase